MNSPTKISPDTQLLLDELRKLSRKFEQFTVEVASRGAPVPTQSVPIVRADNWGGLFDGDVSVPTQVVAADVIADNWGGLFSGGDVSDEPQGEARSTVADNWDGLFEQPAHVLKCSLVGIKYISAADSSTPLSTCSKLTAKEFTAEEFVSGMGGDANGNDLTFTVPDGLLHASQGHAMEIKPEEYPHPSQEELEEERQDANIAMQAALSKREDEMRALAGPPRLNVSPFAPATSTAFDSELRCPTGMYSPRLMAPLADPNAPRGGDEPVFVGADMQRNHNGFAPNVPDLLRCVRLTIHLGHVDRVLGATLLGDYDGSLDDDPEYGAAHLDAPLDRGFGRVGLTLAAAAALREDAIGAAGGGLMTRVAAAGSALTFAEAASNDAAASTTTCSTDCSVGGHNFLYDTCNNLSRSTLGPAMEVFLDVAEHNQPRYFAASLAHAYSIDGAVVRLCSTTIATHAVQRMIKELSAQNIVLLEPLLSMIDKEPLPPTMKDHNILMSRTIELHLVLWQSFGTGIQLRPWPSFYCYEAWVQWIESLIVADNIPPKPPWLAFVPGTLFKVVCSCSNTHASLQYGLQLSFDSGHIQSQCDLCGVTYKFLWLLVFFQYISNYRWSSTAHTDELLMIDFTWEEDQVVLLPLFKFRHGCSGVHSIDADYGPIVLPSSTVPLAWDPGGMERIIYSWSLFFAHFEWCPAICPKFFRVSSCQCTCILELSGLLCWSYVLIQDDRQRECSGQCVESTGFLKLFGGLFGHTWLKRNVMALNCHSDKVMVLFHIADILLHSKFECGAFPVLAVKADLAEVLFLRQWSQATNQELILLDLCFLTANKEVQFSAKCLHLTTRKARNISFRTALIGLGVFGLGADVCTTHKLLEGMTKFDSVKLWTMSGNVVSKGPCPSPTILHKAGLCYPAWAYSSVALWDQYSKMALLAHGLVF